MDEFGSRLCCSEVEPGRGWSPVLRPGSVHPPSSSHFALLLGCHALSTPFFPVWRCDVLFLLGASWSNEKNKLKQTSPLLNCGCWVFCPNSRKVMHTVRWWHVCLLSHLLQCSFAKWVCSSYPSNGHVDKAQRKAVSKKYYLWQNSSEGKLFFWKILSGSFGLEVSKFISRDASKSYSFFQRGQSKRKRRCVMMSPSKWHWEMWSLPMTLWNFRKLLVRLKCLVRIEYLQTFNQQAEFWIRISRGWKEAAQSWREDHT